MRDDMLDDNKHLDRRTVLKSAGGLAGASLLAGCSGGDGGNNGDGGDGGNNGDGGDGGNNGDGGDGDSETEFPEQELTWIVPYSPGGSFDAYARAFAEYMPQHLPGDAEIVVENVEGGGGRRGNNEIMRSDPDGHTFGSWNIPGEITTQLFIDTEYSLENVTWMGRITSLPYILVAGGDSEYESLEDLQAADEVGLTSTSPESTGSLISVIGSTEMDINFNMTFGYDGSSEFLAAVARGEGDATYITYDTVRPFIEDGRLRPIVALSDEPPEYAQDTPTVTELGYDDLAQVSFTQLLGGPEGIPDERVQIIEDALISAAESDEMQEWAEENNRPVNTTAGRDVAAEQVETGREIIENNSDVVQEYLVDN